MLALGVTCIGQVRVTAGPTRDPSKEARRSPRFLGSPLACMPRSTTPVGRRIRPLDPPSSPSDRTTSSAPTKRVFRGSVTRPACSLCTLHASGRPDARNTRYRMVVSLSGWGFHPLSCTRGFLRLRHLPSSPGFPGAQHGTPHTPAAVPPSPTHPPLPTSIRDSP